VRNLAGCDIDEVVLDNPYLDHAEVIHPDSPLPYPDNRFDLVVAQWVFEHVADPNHVAHELLRVVKPGGSRPSHRTSLAISRWVHAWYPTDYT
jgi:SAM-dependent methyltransferase